MENRDIGQMIDESLEGNKPSSEDTRPLHEVIRNMTLDERAQLSADAAAEKKSLNVDQATVRKDQSRTPAHLELQNVDSNDFNNAVREVRAERAQLAPEQRKALSSHEIALITDFIKTTIESDNRLQTAVMEVGIASTDFSSAMHPYGEGLRRVTESLLRPDGEIMRKGPNLFESNMDVASVRRILAKGIETYINAYAADSAQKRKRGETSIELDVVRKGPPVRKQDYKPRRDDVAMRDFVPMNAPHPAEGLPSTPPKPKPKSLFDRLKFWEKDDDKAA